jgi:hypothetical protein
MTDIGELVVRIKADATQLQQELAKATSTVRQNSDQMKVALDSVKIALGALGISFGIAAIASFGKDIIHSTAALEDLAQKSGVSASTLSALKIPLEQNSSSVEEFAASVNFLNKTLGEAAHNNPAAIETFDRLHLSVDKLLKLPVEQRVYAVAQALGAQKDQSNLADLAMKSMGRSAAALIPTIKELASNGSNLEDFVRNAKAAGDALTDEQIKHVKEFDDAWVSFFEHAKIYTVDLVGLLGYLDDLGDWAEKQGETVGQKLRDIFDLGPRAAPQKLYWTKGEDGKVTVTEDQPAPTPEKENPAQGNNDTHRSPASLATYIKSLKDEADAMGLSERAYAIHRAEVQADAKALDDWKNHLRDSKTMTLEERAAVDEATGALYDHKLALEKAEQAAKQMQETLSQSLANMATDWKNAGASITSTIQGIANALIKSRITDPLSLSIVGDPKSGQSGLFGNLFSNTSSLFKFLPHFAEGGSPPVGRPSLVGENGPELFVPNTGGTIIPNGAYGGQSIVVQQTINMSPGLAETVNAAIRTAAPGIAAMARAGVMQGIQNGGPDAKLIGLRS